MGSKRNKLIIENKKSFRLIDKDVSQRTMAVQFGVAKSTVGNINKNRDVILKSWEENCSVKGNENYRQ
jgi:DNA-binding XRE family transcriptional regulator